MKILKHFAVAVVVTQIVQFLGVEHAINVFQDSAKMEIHVLASVARMQTAQAFQLVELKSSVTTINVSTMYVLHPARQTAIVLHPLVEHVPHAVVVCVRHQHNVQVHAHPTLNVT